MELEVGSAAGPQGRWESGTGWSGTHTAVLPMTSWGQIVSSFPTSLQSGLFYFSLQMASPQCLRVCVLSSSDCLAVNSDESQSQIHSGGRMWLFPARVRCPGVCSSVIKTTKLHNANMVPWESMRLIQRRLLHWMQGWGGCGRITRCQSWLWAGLLQLSQQRKQSRLVLLSRKYSLSEKPGALCTVLVICIFVGKTILFSISFVLMTNTYTKYFFLFQTTYSAFIQLLPVLVIVIISVITQLLAANPPYSLFYKS